MWTEAQQTLNLPEPEHWAPIVVDQPAYPFEARPAPGPYRPDTICDGWGTPDVTVRMASVRGDTHRHGGTYRQDHAAVVLHPATGAVLFAVMDGVSDARYAHLGAEAAGHAALQHLWGALDRGSRPDWRDILGAAAGALIHHHRHGMHLGETLTDVERRLATTIVAGIVRPTATGPVATMARVGDSGAWLLCKAEYRCLFEPKGTGAVTISSAVEPLPRVPDRIEQAEVPLQPGSVLLVATDGIGDPLGDGSGLVGQLFARVLERPPPMLGLAHAVGFSRETFDDDRTLVAVWPRPDVTSAVR